MFDLRGGRTAGTPFCSAPALASWQMAPSKGFSTDPASPGFCWCCNFTQLWPWVPLRILGTFKSCLGSFLCGCDRPIGQLTRLKSSRGTQCNFPVHLPIPLLCSQCPGCHVSFIRWSPGKVSSILSLYCGSSLVPPSRLSLLLPFSLPWGPHFVSSLQVPQLSSYNSSLVTSGSKAGQSSYTRSTCQ